MIIVAPVAKTTVGAIICRSHNSFWSLDSDSSWNGTIIVIATSTSCWSPVSGFTSRRSPIIIIVIAVEAMIVRRIVAVAV